MCAHATCVHTWVRKCKPGACENGSLPAHNEQGTSTQTLTRVFVVTKWSSSGKRTSILAVDDSTTDFPGSESALCTGCVPEVRTGLVRSAYRRAWQVCSTTCCRAMGSGNRAQTSQRVRSGG